MTEKCSWCEEGAVDKDALACLTEKGLNTILNNLRALNLNDDAEKIEWRVAEAEAIFVHPSCRKDLD